MTCSACGHDNRSEARFCSACGNKLERTCHACNEVVSPTALFCDHCGSDLDPDRTDSSPAKQSDSQGESGSDKIPESPELITPSEAERRHLTVMFCDLVDSTGLSERLDPEDMRNVLADYQSRCRKAVEDMGGHIARYIGDGVLVYFGYPVAYEDAAARAVRSGLDIVDAIKILDAEIDKPGINLAVRIGINTGNVVVGDIGTGDGREQMAVVGDVPNVAARLQSSAEPGQIVIGDGTQRLVKSQFELASLGEQKHKGVSEALEAFSVVRESRFTDRLDSITEYSANRFVGRDAEIKLLYDRWEQVKEGESQVALLIGEAGIGKSRILQRLRDDLRDQQHQRYYYYCSAHHKSSAFYPIISGVEHEIGFEATDSNEIKLEKIESYLRIQKVSLDEFVPVFAFLLGVTAKEKYPILELNPQQLKQRVFSTFIDQYARVAKEQPLLMIIEDLHWADPSTLELLETWIQHLTDVPCFLVLTFRPEFEFPWRHQSNFTSLALNRLSRRESNAIVKEIAGGKALPAQVLDEIIAKTDGVPLFLEELTKMVLESDLLQEGDEEYTLNGPLPPLAIPESLQDSLMARLEKLEPVKEVAQLAATLGRKFNHKVLAAATGLSEAELQRAIEQLLDAELIVKRGIAPEITYEFKHALVQETAYQTLLKSTRQRYHKRIAELLEKQFWDTVENRPELLAHHYTEAQIADQAVKHWLSAGQKAISRSANLEAIDHIEKGLEALALLPDDLDRTKRELELQIALAVPKTSVKGYASSEVQQTYTRARELCMQIGETPQLFPAIYGMWRFYLLRAQYSTAQELSKQLLNIAERTNDPVFMTAAPRSAGGTYFYRSKLAEAREALEQVINSKPSDEDRSRALLFDVVDALVASHSYNAWALWLQGYPDQAREQSEKAMSVANSLNHQFSIALANSFASWTFEFCGDMSRTDKIAKAALDLSEQYGFQFWVGWARIMHGRALFSSHQDGVPPPLEIMKQGLKEWRTTGSELGQSYFLTLLAEATAAKGEYGYSFELLDEALRFANRTGEYFWLPEIYRVKGELLLLSNSGKNGEVEELFNTALIEAGKEKSKSLELRAAMSLYRLQSSQGDEAQVNQARTQLGEKFQFFTEGFDTADLVAAKQILG
ncbi:MAG: adenylate/guanylate cyclase domain-containing protein [bacterium]